MINYYDYDAWKLASPESSECEIEEIEENDKSTLQDERVEFRSMINHIGYIVESCQYLASINKKYEKLESLIESFEREFDQLNKEVQE